ncbi:hypothetical protein L1987_78360 [Smallanthus sonchifolius]|uniref:Uncharacterized protein n=1 Tax=Smallanthus sonchifolius TaxID=185202 RepID=A0ACB8ZDG5_9ASTR|nr:hypothetical protein L1987_78360 [Smallanthus sonchifolius]
MKISSSIAVSFKSEDFLNQSPVLNRRFSITHSQSEVLNRCARRWRNPGGKLSFHSPPNLQHVDSYDEPKNHRKLRAELGNAEIVMESARSNKNHLALNGEGTKTKITSSDDVLKRLVEWLIFRSDWVGLISLHSFLLTI